MSERYVHKGPALYKPLSDDSIGEQLYDGFKNNSKKDAFIDAITGERVSYSSYLEVTCRLAVCMRNIGLKANDIISVCSHNSTQFFQPVVAALYVGIIVAPINHTYIEGELLHTLSLTKPKVLFCSTAAATKFISARGKCPYIERVVVLDLKGKMEGAESLEDFMAKNCTELMVNGFKPLRLNIEDHIAAILCSSGTTGLPKGVITTHKNLSVRVNNAADPSLNTYPTGDTRLGLLPFFHSFGFITTLTSIILGETVIVLPRFEENLFLASIQNYKITHLSVAPPIVVFLAKSPLVKNYDLSCIRELVCGAAPLGKQVQNEAKERLKLKCIRQGYGLTESTLGVIVMPPEEERPGCSGKVLPDLSVKLRDPETGETLGPRKLGEICVKGAKVTKGYYNNPKATKEMFTSDGWMLTGDLAYYDEEGYFYIVDRLKELIKYKGFQVAPAELEALLLQHSKIKDAGVVGLPDANAGELPLAFVVKQPGAQLTEDEVKKFVADNVSHTKQLRGGVRFIDAIPKNASGKILRRQIRELLKDTHSKL